MFLADFHMHSNISPDADNTMTEMALAAAERGVRCVCFTDHCDLDDYTTGIPDPECFARIRAGINAQYEQARALSGQGIDVRLGLELGEMTHNPALALEISAAPELDFVLGSLHNVAGMPDFYDLKYESMEHCRDLLHRYMGELIGMVDLGGFDSMAHIGYSRRYMYNAGFDAGIDLEHHGDELESLFQRLIHKGIGIEINCSGFRHPGLAGPIPSPEVLTLYRQLGGEVLTVGGDSHCVTDAGTYIAEGYELLRSLGFKYITIFKKRRMEMVRI